MDKFTAVYAKMIDKINGKINRKHGLIKEQSDDKGLYGFSKNLGDALNKAGFWFSELDGWDLPLGKDNLFLYISEIDDGVWEIRIDGIEDYNETDPQRAEPGYFPLCDANNNEEFSSPEEAIRAIGAVPPDQRYFGEGEDPDVDSNCKEPEINKAYDIIANVAKLLDGGVVTEQEGTDGGDAMCKPRTRLGKRIGCGKPGCGKPGQPCETDGEVVGEGDEGGEGGDVECGDTRKPCGPVKRNVKCGNPEPTNCGKPGCGRPVRRG